jgi:splicing factor 3A subunit 3
LPLGWDGKPIPYWLYKLHGLGIEYKCEICGNFSYWGRRAFEMHFQEWRHNYGMRCLKIPNTVHFKDITTISDAMALHEKLTRESQDAQFRPDAE